MSEGDDQNDLRAERLSRLIHTGQRSVTHNPLYSQLVKALRFILPIVAIVIVVIVMAWPKMEQAIAPITPESVAQNQQPVTQNELINPRFEGADSGNNPYVIIADRAVQSTQNPDVLLLTKPHGDVTLENDGKLDITAHKGNYKQNSGILMLDGDVLVKHNSGYDMDTQRLMIDIKGRITRTDQPVRIVGPAGTLNATGMDTQSAGELIIFTGPAKLVLKDSIKGL